jgi:hydroxymethylpyrimidine pyrophosphatase-like HAD family hydrolase
MKTIAVDLDGTLALDGGKKWWDFKNLKPNKIMVNAVNKLANDGHLIIIYTSREYSYYDTTKAWLDKHGVIYDDIAMGKLRADFYVDDKAIHPNLINILLDYLEDKHE